MLTPVLSALTDLVLARTCVGCGAAEGPLCIECGPSVVLRAASDPPITAAGVYDGGLRTALLAYKERSRRDLAGALGRHLARAVAHHRAGVLVPVPSTAVARRQRGGDHVLRLARGAGRECRIPVATPLRLVRGVRDSAGLDIRARAENVGQAMAARRSTGISAVLVDDIATTGSTLHEAARALRTAGWDVRGAAVVGATLRRCAPSSTGGSFHAGLAWTDLTE